MLRQVMIGIAAGVLAIVVLAMLRSSPPAQHPLFHPPPATIAGIDAYLPRPGELLVRPAYPATRPAAGQPKLDAIIERVDFRAMPLEQVLDRLSKATGTNICVNWRALDTDGITRDRPIDLKLQNATAADVLSAVLHQASTSTVRLQHFNEGAVVIVTTWDRPSPNYETRVYDVRDLLIRQMKLGRSFERAASTQPTTRPRDAFSPDVVLAQELAELVRGTLTTDVWGRGGHYGGQIYYWSGKLIITETPGNHDRIEGLLNVLRKDIAAP